jgi:hypothetical protein
MMPHIVFRLAVTSFPDVPLVQEIVLISGFAFFPKVERDDGRPRGGALDGHVGHGASGGRAVGEDEAGKGEGRTRGN